MRQWSAHRVHIEGLPNTLFQAEKHSENVVPTVVDLLKSHGWVKYLAF